MTRNFTTANHGQFLGRRWQSSLTCVSSQLVTDSHGHTRSKGYGTHSPLTWRCIRSSLRGNRTYSSQSGRRTQGTTAQDGGSTNKILPDNGAAGAKISQRQGHIRLPVSGHSVLDIDVNSQQISHLSQGVTPPSPKYWDHRLLKNQDGETVPIHYCYSLKHTESVAQLFLDETVLGFDLEWQPQASKYSTIQENVSLIQLASRHRIALFHVSRFKPASNLEDLVSPTLKKILENPGITKTGVAISNDSTRLRKYLGIEVRGRFELSHLYKLIKYNDSDPSLINKRLISLNQQVEEHLGLPLKKDSDVRCSNWNRALTHNQVFCKNPPTPQRNELIIPESKSKLDLSFRCRCRRICRLPSVPYYGCKAKSA